jgi:hypothetical protein
MLVTEAGAAKVVSQIAHFAGQAQPLPAGHAAQNGPLGFVRLGVLHQILHLACSPGVLM